MSNTAAPKLDSPIQEKSHRSIGGAALLIMVFFVLSRIAGLAREVIIGAQFGASADLDAYLAAFRVPDLLFQLVAGGALGSAFIPVFSDYRVNEEYDGAWLLLSRVLNLVTLALVFLAGLAALAALPLVQTIIAPGFPLEQQMLTASLMRWMLLGTVVFGASGLIMGALNAVQHFLLPAAAPIVYNLAIILGALLLAPIIGVYGLAVGAAAGSLCHLLIQLPALIRQGYRYSLSLGPRDQGVKNVIRLMGPRALGLFAVQMQFLVNTILASGLTEGSISALNYAMLIMLLPQGVFAQAIATASFPTFAAQVAAGKLVEMRETFSRMLSLVMFLTIPAAVVLYILRIPLIQVLLERGEFDPHSTELVAFALQFYTLGLVAHSALEVTVRAYYAMHDTWTPVIFGVSAMVLNIVLSILWVTRLSYGGLALANSVATTFEALVLLWLLGRRMEGFDGWRIGKSAMRTTFSALFMGAMLWLWIEWSQRLEPLAHLNNDGWLQALGGLVLAAISYGVISLVINGEEARPAINMLTRRVRSDRAQTDC